MDLVCLAGALPISTNNTILKPVVGALMAMPATLSEFHSSPIASTVAFRFAGCSRQRTAIHFPSIFRAGGERTVYTCSCPVECIAFQGPGDRKSTRLNSSHL